MPRGSNTPQLCCAARLMPRQLAAGYLTECTTWTTDGFYRETRDMVEHRVKQGCQVVEMECATMAAIARFRGKEFGQLLYSGDILVGMEEYDDRNGNANLSAREKIFRITLEALSRFLS